jgi:hypothetical protein
MSSFYKSFIPLFSFYYVKKGIFIKTPCEEKFEDTNGVIISLTLKMTDSTMAKTKTDQRTNNDLPVGIDLGDEKMDRLKKETTL